MRRPSILALSLALLSATLLVNGVGTPRASAQDDGDDPETPSTETPTDAAEEPSAEETARRARVVARVGDATVTLGDVEDAIAQQSPYMRVRYRDRAQLEAFVQSMIRFELLARAAERADVGETREVQRVVKQNAVQQLIRREFDERITPGSIDVADVEAYFSEHPEEFSRPEMRRASHVQVASREEADRLVSQAREADARGFRDLAREHSTDTQTRLRGGDLRYFGEDGRARNTRDPQVHEALAAAAFGLDEVGDVTDPIVVGEYFSVLKLTGRRPAENRSFAQAEPTIRQRLFRENRQQAMEEFVARLRREGNVEVHHDLIRPIRLDEPEREDAEEEDSHGEPAPQGLRRPTPARPGTAERPARVAPTGERPEQPERPAP